MLGVNLAMTTQKHISDLMWNQQNLLTNDLGLELLIPSPVCAVVLKAKQRNGYQHFSLIYWNHFSCCSAFICVLNLLFGISGEGITSTSEEVDILGYTVRTDGQGVLGMCFHDISALTQSILNVLVYDWIATQNSIFWYGTIKLWFKEKTWYAAYILRLSGDEKCRAGSPSHMH